MWIVGCAVLAHAQAVADDVSPTGTSAALVDGAGVVLGVGASSPDVFGASVDVPVAPRLELGGFLEPADGVLVGLRTGAISWFDTEGVRISGEAAASVAVGSLDRTVWAGLEAGVANQQPTLPNDITAPVPLPERATSLLAAGLFGFDLDPLSSIGLRLGLALGPGGELQQRHGLVVTYRPAPRTGVSLGVHGTIVEGTYPLVAQVMVHQRFGPLVKGWTPPPPREVRLAAVVDAHPHPELRCENGDIPTGRPPPLGQEGWCVRVAQNGRVSRQGPYVRWHDMVTVAERGQYVDGKRSGEWTRFDHEGNLRERGSFVADIEEGRWITYWADGAVQDEGDLVRGEPHGRWRFYDEKGRLKVDGTYEVGARVGRWVDYDPSGTEVRERIYDDGRLVSTNQLQEQGDVDPNAPGIEGSGPPQSPEDGAEPGPDGEPGTPQ